MSGFTPRYTIRAARINEWRVKAGNADSEEFAVYIVETDLEFNGRIYSWKIEKRYTQFRNLRRDIERVIPQMSSLDFPSKRYFFNLSEDTLKQRSEVLTSYMQEIINYDNESHELLGFLEVDNNVSLLTNRTPRGKPLRSGSVGAEEGPPQMKDFTVLKIIGKGSFGKVYLVRPENAISSQELYAMKVLNKADVIRRHQIEHTLTERKIMAETSHPFIISMRFAFQSKERLYMITDYCPGGELYFHLKKNKVFSLNVMQFIAAQIAMALEHLHAKNIIYRDLKPENILLDRDGNCKLTDFGLSKITTRKLEAKPVPIISRRRNSSTSSAGSVSTASTLIASVEASHIKSNDKNDGNNKEDKEGGDSGNSEIKDNNEKGNEKENAKDNAGEGDEKEKDKKEDVDTTDNESLSSRTESNSVPSRRDSLDKDLRSLTFCGTPEYLSPEMLIHRHYGTGYGQNLDWWGLGVVCYELIIGWVPFYDQSFDKMCEKIVTRSVKFPTKSNVPTEVKSFIRGLLHKDPKKRLCCGYHGAGELQTHTFFADMDWDSLERGLISPPFLPHAINKVEEKSSGYDFLSKFQNSLLLKTSPPVTPNSQKSNNSGTVISPTTSVKKELVGQEEDKTVQQQDRIVIASQGSDGKEHVKGATLNDFQLDEGNVSPLSPQDVHVSLTESTKAELEMDGSNKVLVNAANIGDPLEGKENSKGDAEKKVDSFNTAKSNDSTKKDDPFVGFEYPVINR